MQNKYLKGGINWRQAPWHEDLAKKKQCVLMQNLRWVDDYAETIPGTKKYHGKSLGTVSGASSESPVTAIMPYYNDQTDDYVLLAASGRSIYKKDESANEFSELVGALTPNSIFSSATRYGTMYIPSVADGLKKYSGGNQIEKVGGGATQPGSFRVIVYMKEIDRLFGISDDAILGQISWCELGEPEVWDGASVERFKLKDGERVEGAEVLFGKLIIFCTYSVWIYYVQGNEENWRLEEAPTSVGCVAPNTIKKMGKQIWFMGESPEFQLGIYSFNGSDSTLLTDDMSPLFDRANKHRLRHACAGIRDSLYLVSFAIDSSVKNNICLDIDSSSVKEDGSPAIYGPHTFGFYSSVTLNNRQKSKEFLIGGEDDGFIYVESGTTFKSTNGVDGELIQPYFQSRTHNGDDWEIIKRYSEVNVMFRPRGYFDVKLRWILSSGVNPTTSIWKPSAQAVSYAGEFNIYEKPLLGTPYVYGFTEYPGPKCLGTSIQIEILSDSLNGRIAFDEYGFKDKAVRTARKVQRYAL